MADSKKNASSLEAEVERLKKAELELKSRLSRTEKELEVTKGALGDAKTVYREVSDAVAPLVDALLPKPQPMNHEVLVTSLQESVGGMKKYICDLAGTCAVHILSLVKAVYPGQDTKPFVEGRVKGVPDSEFPTLEE